MRQILSMNLRELSLRLSAAAVVPCGDGKRRGSALRWRQMLVRADKAAPQRPRGLDDRNIFWRLERGDGTYTPNGMLVRGAAGDI